MRKRIVALTIFIVLALAACQRGDAVIETTPMVAPTVPTATLLPTPLPDTPTVVPDAPTSQPTNQPTAVPPTPSIVPTPTDTPIPINPVTSINLVPISSGFNKPVYLTHAGDERVFVVGLTGTIQVIQDNVVLPKPFLNIDPLVGSGGERGLLSMAFHPKYPENGRFFVYYTDNRGDTVVARYQVSPDDPNQADPSSALILLTLSQPEPNHNGGQLQFGPDGYLYIGLGDGGGAGDPLEAGQDPSILLGTLLRLDVDFDETGYAIPADNPFVNDDAKRNEIWAYGLRNPWRFSFDRLTGDLYIADVGQNTWEEIHFQPADSRGGENYGWNIMEGTHCFNSETCDQAGLEIPVIEYQHGDKSCSVTGGYVYRGQQFMSLYGNYFYGDYCSGKIWSLMRQGDGSWLNNQIFDQEGLFISSFGEDANGELYVLSYADGTIYQIQP